MRVIFVDCANHPDCLCALGFYEPASDAKEQVRWMNAQQWPAYAGWLKQYPNDALEWTSCNPDSKTPEQVIAASAYTDPTWTPENVVALDYSSRSPQPGREVAWPDWGRSAQLASASASGPTESR